MAIRVFMVHSHSDRPDLARLLVRRQIQFVTSMALIHARLLFYRLGIGSVDASGAMRSFEAVRRELRLLRASPATTAA